MAGFSLNSKRWSDLVFEDRNKDYGAYQLRKFYNRRGIIGIIAGVLIAALIACIPIISSAIKARGQHKNVVVHMETKLANVHINQPQVKKPPKIPKIPPPAVAVKQVKFTAPKVVKQNKITKKDIPPPASSIPKNAILAGKQQKGLSKFQVPVGDIHANGKGKKIVGSVINSRTYSYAAIQQKPHFPGGYKAYVKYIQDHFKYPEQAKAAGVQGRVRVKFTIEPDGSITHVEVIGGKNIGFGIPKEAEKLIKNMPNWIPGKQNGRAVRVTYSQPIVFKLKQRF
jgi:protein TonB